MQHNDMMKFPHIVVKDDSPLIIDFAHASAHDCRCTMVISEGAYRPTEHEFGCSEVYQYARKACIWRPGTFVHSAAMALDSDMY